MNKLISTIVVFLILFPSSFIHAQVDQQLKEDIIKTGYVHRPLPLDYSKSYESFGLTKKVLQSDMLCDMENLDGWSHKGIGNMTITDDRFISGTHSMHLAAPTTYPQFLG
ncbi:MAG: hypothetical protein ACK5HT_09730 [Draconibacterium sp.]